MTIFAALEDEEAIENDPVEEPPSHKLYERRLAAVREGEQILVALDVYCGNLQII